MSTEVVVAIVAASASILAATVSVGGAWWRERQARRAEADAILERFKIPLLQAAFELQSRLWNILSNDFLRYYRSSDDRKKNYVLENTLFVIGQYFCWTEIIRREIQFLRVGTKSIELLHIRTRVYNAWQEDRSGDDSFMIWAGEQRAIGEAMIVDRGEIPDCVGFASFGTIDPGGSKAAFDGLREDIEKLASGDQHGRARLVEVQNALIDLLELLDPDFEFFPAVERTKVSGSAAA